MNMNGFSTLERVRIYCEDPQPQPGLASPFVWWADRLGQQGATQYMCNGLWEGMQEDSMVIEFIVSRGDASILSIAVHSLIREFCDLYDQEEILFTREPIMAQTVRIP